MSQRILPLLALLFALSRASEATNPYFGDCLLPRRCDGSRNINVSYPFRLPNSPSYCGVPGYDLYCSDLGSKLSIKLSGGEYRVQEIDYEEGLLRVVDSDFIDNPCPRTFRNTSINSTLFDFADTDLNLTVYVNCTIPISQDLQQIFCLSDPLGLPSYFRVAKGPSSILIDLLKVCELAAAVPVYEASANSLKSSSSNFSYAIQQGFGMKWSAGTDWCTGCIHSGGVCGYNSTRADDPICFCPNNSELGSCPYAKKESSQTGLIIGLSTAGVFSFIMLCAVFFLLYRRWKKKQQTSSLFPSPKRATSLTMSHKTDAEPGSSLYTPIFSYQELYEATNGFDSSKELGDGGFGTVYKGKLKDGRTVAVKRLHENSYRSLEQFMNEVKIVSLLRHQHLASLYGCTSRHSRELLLVYEFVPNGTIADHLHGSRASAFVPWNVRMRIAIETADALHYLHSVEPQIIHRDIKSNNILLDNGFHVKLADFGLSRLFPLDATHVSTAPQGTPGYVDPEYHNCFQLTDKSDVYSFGVVLMELISSKPAVDLSRGRNEINLAYMAIGKIQRRELHEFVDPRLGYQSDARINSMVTQVAGLAFRCLQLEREMRPAIKEVVDVLREIESVGGRNGDSVDVLREIESVGGKNGDSVDVLREIKIVGGKNADCVDVDEEAGLLKSALPHSPNSVADRWVSASSLSSVSA